MGNCTLNVMDQGNGADIGVSLDGFCESGLAQCPTGYITDHDTYAKSVSNSQCQSYQLHYQTKKPFGLLNALKFILAEDKLTQLPHTTYQLCITQCAGKPQQEYSIIYRPHFTRLLGELANDCFINIYPKTEIESELTLSYQSASEEVSDEQRYEEYFARQKDGSYQGDEISTEKITRSFKLDGNLTIKQGRVTTQYQQALESSYSNFTHTHDLQTTFDNVVDQWRLINGIIEIIRQIKDGTYTNAGRDKVNLVSFSLGKPVLKFSGTQTTEIIDSQLATSGELALGFLPLFDFKLTLDLVLAAAAYFKMERAVAEIREQAQKLEDKVKAGKMGAYVGAEFFVALSGKLDVEGSMTYRGHLPVDYGLSAVSTLVLSADVNVRGGAKVWVVEGAFQLAAEISAECKCAIRSNIEGDNSKVELTFFHNGIKAMVKIETSASIKSDGNKSSKGDGGWGGWFGNTSVDSSVSYTEEKEWQWVEALSETDSPYKAILIGDEK